MRIGIYGGTFDPPHLGHMEAACAALGQLDLDQILLIPNALPPHKSLPQDSASAEHRFAMTEIMADGVGAAAVTLDLELLRNGPGYTIDTVMQLRGQYPDGEFFLLMGTDMFLSFQNWHKAAEIAKEVTLAPFAREESGSYELFAVQTEALKAQLGAKVRPLALPKIYPISSTQIRRLLESRSTCDEGGSHLWTSVYGYILRHGLYQTRASLGELDCDRLRAASYSMMRAKRIPHVRGVEEVAVTLARRWGVDVEMARRAAILHDCTKYYNLEEQLAVCKKYGIVVDGLADVSEKILHAITGAALASHVFGQEEDVCQAIANHTTGHPDMTTLDKVIYLADYVEPNRSFEGVEELRSLAFEDLDRGMLLGLEMTVAELKQKKAIIHPNTRMTLAQLKGTRL